MAGSRQDRARALCALFVLLALSGAARAERLPIKTYTTADGLAREHISRIVRDSRGFLWFCTSEGLSRFDGYKFTNYGIDQGLPGRVVTDFLESHNGDYWVATNEGLGRFILDPSPQTTGGGTDSQKKFVVYHPGESRYARQVNTIREDRAGTIWCGTDGGLFRLDPVDGQWLFSFVEIPKPMELREVPGYLSVRAILHDRRGTVWVSANGSLFRFRSDGGAEAYATKEGLHLRSISSALLEDRDGQIWVGTIAGLCLLVPDPQPGRNVVARVYTTKDGLANDAITSLFQSSDGKIWVGTFDGLSEFVGGRDSDGSRFQSYTTANGLIEEAIVALGEDRNGNLWIGTESSGAMKLAVNGFTTYLEGDGLGHTRIGSILEDRADELCAVSGGDIRNGFINRFDRRKFAAVRLALPRGSRWGWGWYQTMFEDRAGEWWMSTGQGLVRYPKITRLEQLTRARPKAIYTIRDGLIGDLIFRIFEDSRGDIWISTINDNQDGLTRWERATGTFHRYSFADGFTQSAPSAFCEDRAGNLWIGFYNGGLARYTAGRFTFFSDSDGVPLGVVRGIYLDSSGRLWIAASEGGAARVDDPNADRPRFDTYTTGNGLSSNQATCVTEDRWGRIYIGTGRGVDRLDPVNGNIRHYTTTDGLASNFISVSFRARDGTLWFGTFQGLSRLIPQPDRAALPPPVLISALHIAGAPHPISELGAAEIAGPELSASRNQIQIDFLALSLGVGEALRYQFKLEGANQDWSAPADQRTVNYPNLPPGAYRFLVRAVSADGTLSESPATVSFKILSPIWQRWWFLALAAILLATIIFTFDRYRAARMKELQGALTQSTMLTVKLAVKQEDLRRANRTLALEYAVTSILAESPTVSDAAPRILQAICESTGWEIGELWDADPQAGVLRCVDVWHMEMKDAAEFETHSKTITFLPDVGLPGRGAGKRRTVMDHRSCRRHELSANAVCGERGPSQRLWFSDPARKRSPRRA
ncbi:MAG: two-component regulator propeller domain-containing protein [Acidobacteriota bacterium]